MTQVGKRDSFPIFHHRTTMPNGTGKIEMNLNTAFRVTRAVLPAMIEAPYGRIVQYIASVTGPLVAQSRIVPATAPPRPQWWA